MNNIIGGALEEAKNLVRSELVPYQAEAAARFIEKKQTEHSAKILSRAEASGVSLSDDDIQKARRQLESIVTPGWDLASFGYFLIDFFPGLNGTDRIVNDSLKALTSPNSSPKFFGEAFTLLEDHEKLIKKAMQRMDGDSVSSKLMKIFIPNNKQADLEKVNRTPYLNALLESTNKLLDTIDKSILEPNRHGNGGQFMTIPNGRKLQQVFVPLVSDQNIRDLRLFVNSIRNGALKKLADVPIVRQMEDKAEHMLESLGQKVY